MRDVLAEAHVLFGERAGRRRMRRGRSEPAPEYLAVARAAGGCAEGPVWLWEPTHDIKR